MSQKESFYGYIYLTINLQTKKVYVGQKGGLPEQSIDYLGSGTRIGYSIKKYGKQFFKKIILGILEADSKKELKILLNEAETECIYFYRAYGSDGIHYDEVYGYNLTNQGSTTRGYKKSLEQIEKEKETRLANGGYIVTEETRQKISRGNKDKKKTEEHRKNISKGQIGHTCSEDRKQKISNSLLGHKRTQESIDKQFATRKKNYKPKEKKKKIKVLKQQLSEQIQGKTYDEFYGEEKAKVIREKQSKSKIGKPSKIKGIPKSEEMKIKLRISLKNRKYNYSIWLEKYGKEEADRREELRKEKNKQTKLNKK